ncbi:dihydrofolate reductase [Clostridium pasteurianum DSM 525 = ATCC 6013]|uniref:Dihydrofolate reductase n=1 Tax=Clostridium pasteurianum DSM 525 = ATCC 6013 TaxID=1262449 RepID=A0A0H3J572_CLOPA|nr:dihydrofolate reductase [Clostridium pasteurianum]AJA48267.1 dihydrofolate reductase [Clostridium pasteurianum DSM 525 = ATCC 6013]AJA52255.1 dihydrofolate reductase [Clostridium pasteurianum DSM 525 = ATCC 6013]AOZ75521.1 diacylglycerol kinase [Clostridium pasteurianum DSM 525 = ATCC 6013]AOZ79316.1 diacylglycerol kinase [Clostridium pasteurianum]ELP60583.1 Dihydrofolate reductase [Clostridium pasteurianum DSM 525 = ATCC 6013]
MLTIIAAVAKNNVIGKDNKLLWNLPEDLKRFKEITKGHTIIMGRKTFESLPKILPDRHHIVITRNKTFKVEDDRVTVINSIEKLMNLIKKDEEYFVIGGADIYNQLLPYAEKMYITVLDYEFDGDAFFPVIDSKLWRAIDSDKQIKSSKSSLFYRFITFKRISDNKK